MKIRKTQALHHGRWSAPEARYFVTCRARLTASSLVEERVPCVICEVWSKINDSRDAIIACATIMPDHVHLLLTLGERLTLGQLIAKIKGLTCNALQEAECRWQRDYFEHRLRPTEAMDPYARYIFMNPYRAALVEKGHVWPHWLKHQTAHFSFLDDLDKGMFPPDEWLTEHDPFGVEMHGD